LTWRLFEVTHALDRNGEDTETAVFELLANGGAPARVALGRRASLGCVAGDPSADGSVVAGVVASLDCYYNAHGEYVVVERRGPTELRVEAFGQDEAYPGDEPPRTQVQTAVVQIPRDAVIVVDPEVARVPDEARPR
jgi:hypothetical protein